MSLLKEAQITMDSSRNKHPEIMYSIKKKKFEYTGPIFSTTNCSYNTRKKKTRKAKNLKVRNLGIWYGKILSFYKQRRHDCLYSQRIGT